MNWARIRLTSGKKSGIVERDHDDGHPAPGWSASESGRLRQGAAGPARRPGDARVPDIHAPTNGHSVKPEVFRALIESLYREGPYLELFGRRPAPGWTSWGDLCLQRDGEAGEGSECVEA